MFALALTAGKSRESSRRFHRWLSQMDPSGALCPIRFEETFSWGWMGVAGAGQSVVLRQDDQRQFVVVSGQVLDKAVYQALTDAAGPWQAGMRLAETTGQFVFAKGSETASAPLVVGTDNLGMRPLFWNGEKKEFSIANHSTLCGLLAGRLELDESYVLDLTLKDAVLPWQSLLKGVRRVQRGRYLQLEAGRMHELPVRHFHDLSARHVSRAQAIESLCLATQSLAGHPQDYFLGLTGGRDSRLIMAMLLAEKIAFESGTHAMPCPDGQIAQQLADKAGVTHYGISRANQGVMTGVVKYLRWLPWSEGTMPLHTVDAPVTVHDMAAQRGMIHLGGLGGEVARSYWDQPEADFQTPEHVLQARFFRPYQNDFYLNARRLSQSREDWNSLLRHEGIDDPFVGTHIAYLDARLRGTLVLRTNCAWFDYAWPMANPEFYAYAWRLPRRERQQAAIFEEFIRELSPELLSVPWAAGNAGVYTAGQNWMQRAKGRLKQSRSANVLRGRFRLLQGQSPTFRKSEILLRAFFRDREAHAWLRETYGTKGVERLETCSSTYINEAQRSLTLYLMAHVVHCLQAASEAESFWDLPWLQAALKLAQSP